MEDHAYCCCPIDYRIKFVEKCNGGSARRNFLWRQWTEAAYDRLGQWVIDDALLMGDANVSVRVFVTRGHA